MSGKKIVITGVGAISSMGEGFDSLKQNLPLPQRLGTAVKSEFHELDQTVPCFRADSFDPETILGKKGLRLKDWSTKILLSALEKPFKDRFDAMQPNDKPGICIGTAFGSVQSIGEFLSDSIVNGVNNVNPQAFANTVINSPTGNANIRYESRSLSSTIATGFSAGLDAVIYSCDYIKRGHINAIVAGGLEEISYYSLLGMERSGVLSHKQLMQPFCTSSDGWIAGEGCAAFMIETEESAKSAGAGIIAEIVGYASAFDPDTYIGAFSSEAASYAMKTACEDAGISTSQIDFIAASANGMSAGDSMEAQAILDTFGKVPVTSYKYRFGECYGASPALSIACAIADMKSSRITGIGDYRIDTGINAVVGVQSKPQCTYALINAFSCDGYCSSIVIKNSVS